MSVCSGLVSCLSEKEQGYHVKAEVVTNNLPTAHAKLQLNGLREFRNPVIQSRADNNKVRTIF